MTRRAHGEDGRALHDLFSECLALRDGDDEIVAIDGKSSRRAHGEDGRALHLVSAWATRQRSWGKNPVTRKRMKSARYLDYWRGLS